MVQCIRVDKKEANKVKINLIKKNILNKEYKIKHEKESILIPVTKGYKNYKILKEKLEPIKEKSIGLNKLLEKIGNKKEIKNLRTSLEVIGEIAILELDKELLKKKQMIGEAILKSNKNLKSVLLKVGGRHGTFRLQDYEYLAGFQDTETIYKESGISIKLDPKKTYFTPRLGSERLRIAKQVKNENVLVMFSGVGIYPFIIAKYSKAKSIIGIEINPDANYYAEESLKINKFKNIEFICADVREAHIHGTFDRIVMPAPECAMLYLDLAIKLIKNKGIIHLYFFSEENKLNEKINFIKEKVNCKILEKVKCGQKSPKVYRYCIDLQVLE